MQLLDQRNAKPGHYGSQGGLWKIIKDGLEENKDILVSKLFEQSA